MTRASLSALSSLDRRVTCAGTEHRLIWTAGGLRAVDHQDVDRERTLVALGADPYPCVQIADLWTRHAEDLDVLVCASRGPSDALSMLDDPFDRPTGRSTFASMVSPGLIGNQWQGFAGPKSHIAMPHRVRGWTMRMPGDDEAPADDLGTLLALGDGLAHRLVATGAATWADRLDAGDERARCRRCTPRSTAGPRQRCAPGSATRKSTCR